MNATFKKFLLFCILAGILIVSGAWLIKTTTHKAFELLPVYIVVLIVFFITLIFHFYLLTASKGNPKTFFGKFIASSGLKLMIYLGVIVFYILTQQQSAKEFLITFLVTYFTYTVVEISFILSHLKK